MFEQSLKDSFKSIFQIDKVTYSQPSEAKEQECIFVEIDSARPTIKDGRQICKVSGRAQVFAQNDKLPFGFFAKKIKQADSSLTRDFFFFDVEESAKVYQNLVQRSFSFVYFFNSQYDPDIGTMTGVDTSVDIQ